MRPWIVLGFLACWVATLPPQARGQDQASNVSTAAAGRVERRLEQLYRDTRLLANPNVSPAQRSLLEYGGYFVPSYLDLDDAQNENHVLRTYDIVGYGRFSLDGAHDVFARIRYSYRDFHRGDSFSGEGDEGRVELEQAFYRFDLRRHIAAYHGAQIDSDLTVQAGRQLVYWGNGLTLSQDIDGIWITAGQGLFSADVVAGVSAPYTIDFDTSRPDFDDDTQRGFYGLMLSLNLPKHRPYVYGLIQQDYNDDDPLPVVSPFGPDGEPVITESGFGYDSYYIGVGATGGIGDRFAYGIEATYEGGTSRSRAFVLDPNVPGGITPVSQTDEQIEAWALDGRLDYLFPDRRRSRVSAEVILASGDPDRISTTTTFGGNLPGTSDSAFNAFGLLNTGLAFAPAVSNIIVTRLGASTFPAPEYALLRRFQVGADVLLFNKMRSDAPIEEPTTDDSYLGWETDLYANWQINSDVALAVRYGIFFPSDAIVGGSDPRHLIYVSLSFGF